MGAALSGIPWRPLPVVGLQYCAPYVVHLTVRKKVFSFSNGDFKVTNNNGAVVFRVNGAIFSMLQHRVLLDAAGKPILSMQRKVFSMNNRWKVFRGDSSNASDLLFTVKTPFIFQKRPNMDIFMPWNTTEQACDFKMRGNYYGRSSRFYLGNSHTMIAQMENKCTVSNGLSGKGSFRTTVFPFVDYAFIATLVVILGSNSYWQ